MSQIKLGKDQLAVMDAIIHSDEHCFITGRAGTGKTVLLEAFRDSSTKKLVVVAPTGVAAINVRGQTIHSLFRVPPGFHGDRSPDINEKLKTLLSAIEVLVIDEVSMVRADLLDFIDRSLRIARGAKDTPFGGVQVVMFGDPYQLPPVVEGPQLESYFTENHGGPYFFNANVWTESDLTVYELHEVFRQKDEAFIHLLDRVRVGEIDSHEIGELNELVTDKMPSGVTLTLATTNRMVNRINHQHLGRLKGSVGEFKAIVEGKVNDKAFPTDHLLKLKNGAQIMLVRNDPERRWVNGTMGLIHSLGYDRINVDIDGSVHAVEKESWQSIKYSYEKKTKTVREEVAGSFEQFPLRLAWAVTIHKSQGQTFDSVVVDTEGGAFASGQLYVALSRCKDRKGLHLRRPLTQSDVIVDPIVRDFMSRLDQTGSSPACL